MSNYSIQMKAAFVECLSRAVPLHNVIILNRSAFILDVMGFIIFESIHSHKKEESLQRKLNTLAGLCT